jgi:hypothetical protein
MHNMHDIKKHVRYSSECSHHHYRHHQRFTPDAIDLSAFTHLCRFKQDLFLELIVSGQFSTAGCLSSCQPP